MAVLVLKLVLAGLNMAVLCLVLALSLNHMQSQHDLRSWATVFFVLAFLWLLLRGAFWTMSITQNGLSEPMFYLFYWGPNPLQFASFLLLPLFYGQVLNSKRKWAHQWRYIRPVYIALTTSMVLFMVMSAVVAAIQENRELKCLSENLSEDSTGREVCYHPLYQAGAMRVLTTFSFLCLAAVVGFYGVQMARLQTWQHRRFLIYDPRALVALNCVLFIVFLSKGAYQLISTLAIWYLPNIPLQGDADISWLNFTVFCCWDYLPTVLLLLVVTNRGRGAGTGGAHSAGALKILPSRQAKRLPQLPDYGLFREIKIEAQRVDAGGERGHSPFDSTVLSDAAVLAHHSGDGAACRILSDAHAHAHGGGGGARGTGSAGSSYGSASPSSQHNGAGGGGGGGSSGVSGLGGSWRWGRGSVFDNPNRYYGGTPEGPNALHGNGTVQSESANSSSRASPTGAAAANAGAKSTAAAAAAAAAVATASLLGHEPRSSRYSPVKHHQALRRAPLRDEAAAAAAAPVEGSGDLSEGGSDSSDMDEENAAVHAAHHRNPMFRAGNRHSSNNSSINSSSNTAADPAAAHMPHAVAVGGAQGMRDHGRIGGGGRGARDSGRGRSSTAAAAGATERSALIGSNNRGNRW